MKHPYESLFPFLLLVLFCVLCIRPAHADNFSRTPYYSGQTATLTGFYQNPSLVGSAPYIPNATSSNPQGYVASVNSAGALTVTAPTAIAAAAPAGQGVAPALQASAALLAGTAIASSAAFTPILNNPAAAVSAASTFLMAGGTIAAPFNPLVGGALAGVGLLLQGGLSTCQVVGCHFLDGLKTQNVVVDSAGAVLKQTATGGVVPATFSGSYQFQGNSGWSGNSPAAACGSHTCPSGNPVLVSATSCQKTGSDGTCGGPWTFTIIGTPATCPAGSVLDAGGLTCSSTASTSTAPATNADVVAAIAAASASASGAAFRADMINLSLANGMAMIADAQTAQNSQVASAFTQLSSSTDALGNTVQTLARNVSSIAPGANSSLPPVVTNSIQQVTVTNAVPSAITTTSVVNPVVAAAAATTGQLTADMCVQHPDILACADISKLGDLPAVTPLTDTKNIGTLSPVAVGVGFAICPAPIVLPGMMGGPPMFLDVWKYPCEFAGFIKPINIIAASIASIYILMGAFKNG